MFLLKKKSEQLLRFLFEEKLTDTGAVLETSLRKSLRRLSQEVCIQVILNAATKLLRLKP